MSKVADAHRMINAAYRFLKNEIAVGESVVVGTCGAYSARFTRGFVGVDAALPFGLKDCLEWVQGLENRGLLQVLTIIHDLLDFDCWGADDGVAGQVFERNALGTFAWTTGSTARRKVEVMLGSSQGQSWEGQEEERNNT